MLISRHGIPTVNLFTYISCECISESFLHPTIIFIKDSRSARIIEGALSNFQS